MFPAPNNYGPELYIFDVFRRFHNLTANFTANIFGKKHYMGNPKRARKKIHELWSSNAEKDLHFATFCKICILLHCQALHTEVANGTQAIFAKR